MKIGFVIDDGLDKPDGVQQYILTLGSWYTRHGHEVGYLTGQTSRTDIAGAYSLARNIKVSFNGNRFTIPLPARRAPIQRVLDNERFDVLHVQAPYSPFFAAKVVRLAHPDTAVVGTFHILPFNMVTRVGTRFLGIWLRRSLKRFDAFMSVSVPAANFAGKTFKIENTVVPNSIQIDQFKPVYPVKRQMDSLRLLFLGRLVPRKGCQQLLRALAIMHKAGSLPAHLTLDVCGDGPLRNELERFVMHHDLQRAVTFHGFVSHQQKIEFMQQADIAVFPSLSGESFGIVLIEAMAAGSGIVLGGDNPGYQSVLDDAPGSIVNAHEPNVFAQQLQGLFNEPEKRQQLHRLQQAHVKQFDTAIVAKTLLEIYHSCKTTRNS